MDDRGLAGHLRRRKTALWKKSGALPLLMLLALVLGSGLALATAAQATTAQAAEGSTAASHRVRTVSSGHVTIIILDMSGSMAENDPDGLRCSAANAYIDLSGPGDFVGVVGLDGTGTGGPHNFGTPVNWGLSPREMATVNERQALRSAIQEKSHGCHPDSYTPTYAALAEAESMLASATQGTHLSGSVILLTDGVPDPNTSAQISAIEQQLVPEFKAHGWPIDAIALGSDQSFHPFLSGVASATSGSFYDDGHGVVPGVSPLNITPFFLDIFRLRNGRSPGPTIPATQLGGATTARNFSVGQYVTHLDIIVVKDNPGTTVSVLAPDGQRIPPPVAGAFVSVDPHYVIISLDTPQQGAWELDVTGTGLFLMDSLKVSALTLSLTSPSTRGALALGEPITISAELSDQGVPISGGQFSLVGTVTFAGDSTTTYLRDILLSDQGGSGTYSAQVTIPTTAPTGSYQISVSAHAASEDVLTAETVIRLDLFPSALLIGRTGPTTQMVTASATQWDKPLELLYSLPIVNFFSGWPLGGLAAEPSAVVKGQIELGGKPYSGAEVMGEATRGGATNQVPVTFVNDGGGAFHLIFPSNADGTYTLHLTTEGAYSVSHGDLTQVTRLVEVTVLPNTMSQRLRAYLVTLLYLFILAFFLLLLRYILAPKPTGAVISHPGGADEFARARRPWAFFLPSVVKSGQMGLDPGLEFRFRRGGRVSVRGTSARDNYRLAGGSVSEAWFAAAGAELASSDGRVHYSIEAGGRQDGDNERPDTRSELMKRVVGSRPSRDVDDDDDERIRRRGSLWGRRSRSFEAADDERPRRRGRRSRDDDDW